MARANQQSDSDPAARANTMEARFLVAVVGGVIAGIIVSWIVETVPSTGFIVVAIIAGIVVAFAVSWILRRLEQPLPPAAVSIIVGIAIAVIVGAAALLIQEEATTTTEREATTTDECDRFAVYAQGRWTPYGAAVREEPFISSSRVRGIPPNVAISVDAWVETEAAYPDNSEPWDSAVWFRLSDGTGWVSFPGVRSRTSGPEGTDGPAGGGQPVILEENCQVEWR